MKRYLMSLAVLGAMVLTFVVVPELGVKAAKISIFAGVWLMLALYEALKGGINMSLLVEWLVVGFLAFAVIHSWIKGGRETDWTFKRWTYRVVNPIALGVPAFIFAVTIPLGISLPLWILKWLIRFSFVYAAGRYYVESLYWIGENEIAAKVYNWGSQGKGIPLKSMFYFLPVWVYKIVRASSLTVRKRFFLGAISGELKNGEGLDKMLLAKVNNISFSYRLTNLAKSIGRFDMDTLDQMVKDRFLTTFRLVFRSYAYKNALDKRDEIEKMTIGELETLKDWGVKVVDVSLPEKIEADSRIYKALVEITLAEFETKEILERTKIGDKIDLNLHSAKGLKTDAKNFIFKKSRTAEIARQGEDIEEKELDTEQKLTMITRKERAKVAIHLALVGLILIGAIAVGVTGLPRFLQNEANVQTQIVVPAANTTIPVNPSGPSGAVSSPFDKYHIPGFPEGILFWGAVLFLAVVALVNLSKKVPETHWLKKYRMPIIGMCFTMMFYGIFAQALPGIGGTAVLVMVISLMIATSIRKDRILSWIMRLVVVYLIVTILIWPFIAYTMEIQHPEFYKEQIKTGKVFEPFKRIFERPERTVKPPTSAVKPSGTRTVERPKKFKVVEYTPPRVRKFRISARKRWTDTGIDLKRGDRLFVRASGTWDGSGSDAVEPDLPCGPEGIVPPKWVEDLSPYPYHGGRIHELLGKTERGRPFSVGTSYEGVVESPGWFYLGINDWKVSDNDGCLEVFIEVVR